MHKNILIIDDEEDISKLLRITLETNGYLVSTANTGFEGKRVQEKKPADLILLDIGLPDESGHVTLMDLRKTFTGPIIILSVQNREEEIIKALDNGASDYLIKPFRTGELLARIRSSLRGNIKDDFMFSDGTTTLQISFSGRTILRNNLPIKLTSTEFDLLALLISNEGRVLTHQYLLRAIWGPGYISQTQYLRVFIGQLRRKIETEPNRPEFILTESGVGYRFFSKLNH